MPIVKGDTLRDTLYGRIRHAKYISDHNPSSPPLNVIIKEFNVWQVNAHTTKDGQQIYEDASVELSVHSKLQHSGIVQLYDTIYTSDRIYAILEYCSTGELFTLIKQQQFNHMNAQTYFIQLITAIDYIHTQHNVAHRDISLENILLDHNDSIKLCDFGLCYTGKSSSDTINDGKRVGKLKYMAPEVYASEVYSPYKADIWSAGVVLFIMLTGVFPWDTPSVEDARCVQACRGSTAIQTMIAHWGLQPLDHDVLDLLSHIFTSPANRYTSQQIMQHPYVTKSQSNIITATAVPVSVSQLKSQRKSSIVTIDSLQNKQSDEHYAEFNQRDKYFSPAVSRASSYTVSPSSSRSSINAFSPTQLTSPSVSFDSAQTNNYFKNLSSAFNSVSRTGSLVLTQ